MVQGALGLLVDWVVGSDWSLLSTDWQFRGGLVMLDA